MARLRYNGLATGASGSTVGLSLGASLTSGATSVTFNAALTHSNGTAVPTLTGSDFIVLQILDANGHVSEIVYLTAYTAGATTGTISRGQEGTTGIAHASGDKISGGATVLDLDPGAWTAYTPVWAANSGTPNVGSTGSLTGAYQLLGSKTVHFRLNLVLGGTGISTGTGTWNFTLPLAHIAPPSGIGQHGLLLTGYFEDLGAVAYMPGSGRLKSSSTTAFEVLYNIPNGSLPGSGGAIGATAPFTWGTGDYLSVYGMYQAA